MPHGGTTTALPTGTATSLCACRPGAVRSPSTWKRRLFPCRWHRLQSAPRARRQPPREATHQCARTGAPRRKGKGKQAHLRLHGLLQAERVAEVVDVLAGAGKVRELEHLLQLVVLAEVLLEHVLDRLDVVVGRALNHLDLRRGGSSNSNSSSSVVVAVVLMRRRRRRTRRRRTRRSRRRGCTAPSGAHLRPCHAAPIDAGAVCAERLGPSHRRHARDVNAAAAGIAERAVACSCLGRTCLACSTLKVVPSMSSTALASALKGGTSTTYACNAIEGPSRP